MNYIQLDVTLYKIKNKCIVTIINAYKTIHLICYSK